MNYLYPRANLDLDKLFKLAEKVQSLSLPEVIRFNAISASMPWSDACTVRLCLTEKVKESQSNDDDYVDDLLKTLNSITQVNISFLAKKTAHDPIAISYVFTLPPPPPKSGG